MQANVDPFVILNMDGNLTNQMQGLSVRRLEVLKVGPDHIIRLARVDALGELAGMVGIKLPLRLFVLSAADLDLDAVNGTIARTPDGAKDERVRLVRLKLWRGRRDADGNAGMCEQCREEGYDQEEK